jgi:hypothetical protein
MSIWSMPALNRRIFVSIEQSSVTCSHASISQLPGVLEGSYIAMTANANAATFPRVTAVALIGAAGARLVRFAAPS